MEKLLVISNDGELYFEFASLFAQRKIILQLAVTIQSAIDMLSKEEYSAIIIDITFLENINMIKALRCVTSVPIIAYCLSHNMDAKEQSLRNGADEYLTKSGNFDELYICVKSLRRRYYEYINQKKKSLTYIKFQDITIFLNTRRVFIKGKNIELCKKEFEILLYLIKNKDKVLSYEQIYQHVWGERYYKNSYNTLWCQIHRLTMKINPLLSPVNYIINVREVGYQINPILFSEQDGVQTTETAEKSSRIIILVIGYTCDELVMFESKLSAHAIFCHKAESIYEALTILHKDEYALVMINGDTDNYLLSTEIARKITLAPIIITTNNYDVEKKIEAFDKGADKYLQTNEFIEDSHETVIAMIRRHKEYNSMERSILPIISCGDLLINMNNRKVSDGNQDIKLSRKEFDIFRYIVSHKGEIVTYEQICDYVWGDKYNFNSYKPLMVQVHRLKEKIKIKKDTPEYILNIRQTGYILNTEIDI